MSTHHTLVAAAQRLLAQLGPYGDTFEGPHRRELQRAIDAHIAAGEPLVINTPHGPVRESWRDQLDERELKELLLSEDYAGRYRHGTPGHLSYMTIARLAALLDLAQAANEDLRRRLDEATKTEK